MNTKGYRRILNGEKKPHKNQPQNKQRKQPQHNARRKFAQATRLDKLAAKIQGFANRNKILFLVMVFGFVIGTFTFNIYRLTKAYRHGQEIRSATEMQDSLLKERHKEPVAPIVEPTQTRQR